MNRIKEKDSTKFVTCLLYRIWAKWGVVSDGWTDITKSTGFSLFFEPLLKNTGFFCEI
jgi:hypothetical protein